MTAKLESKAAIALVASVIRQLQIKALLGEADIAAIFGHADRMVPGKDNPSVDEIWIYAQEIIAR